MAEQQSKKPIAQLVPSQYKALVPAFSALQREILSPIETKADAAQTTATTAGTDAATAQTTATTAQTTADSALVEATEVSNDSRFFNHFLAIP